MDPAPVGKEPDRDRVAELIIFGGIGLSDKSMQP
jgi:hypothetical protein